MTLPLHEPTAKTGTIPGIPDANHSCAVSCPDRVGGADMGGGVGPTWCVLRHQSLESTNETAALLARDGCPEGTVVLAREQTRGRGRRTRQWHSSADLGLWISAVVRPGENRALYPQLTLVAAVAVARAIREHTGLRTGIKWPNDLLVQGRKLCGILCELAEPSDEQDEPALVIGVGLNVNHGADAFPQGLRTEPTSLRMETGREWKLEPFLDELLAQLAQAYQIWRAQGFEPARREWKENSATLGQRVRLDERGGISGIAWDLDHDGALLIKTDSGVVHRVDSGEIHGPCLADNT